MEDYRYRAVSLGLTALAIGRDPAGMQPEPYDPVSRFDKRKLVGSTRGALKRRWAKFFDSLPQEKRTSVVVSSLRDYGVLPKMGRIRPCRLCHGPAGCAECRAGHGPEFSCAFCEPCGTRPKQNRTKHTPCDGSGVLPARKTREVR